MRSCIRVGRSDSSSGPVARAQGAQLAALHLRFQSIHHFVHRGSRIVAMKEVEIDVVGAEPLEAFSNIALDHLRTQKFVRTRILGLGGRMSTLGDQDQIRSSIVGTYAFAESTLAGS